MVLLASYTRPCSALLLCLQSVPTTSREGPPECPLHPMPLALVPFERVGIDIVRPLIQSSSRNKFLLVLVDYATWYPEATLFRNMRVETIPWELTHVFSRVGIPKQVVTDQGTAFMSEVLQAVWRLLGVQPLRTTLCPPQTNGLVERFNGMLKRMLWTFEGENRRDWPQWVAYLLFAIREVPQPSTEFSSFELLYRRHPQGVVGCPQRRMGNPGFS